MRQYMMDSFDAPANTLDAGALHSSAEEERKRRQAFGQALAGAGKKADEGMKAEAPPGDAPLLEVAKRQAQAAMEARRKMAVLQALSGIAPLA